MANCKRNGSLPRISDRLGELVRTNSEAVLSVLLPEDRGTWQDVTVSSAVVVDGDTQIEFLTNGRRADMTSVFFTVLTGDGTRLGRLRAWLATVLRNPRQWLRTLNPVGWSRRSRVRCSDIRCGCSLSGRAAYCLASRSTGSGSSRHIVAMSWPSPRPW